MESVCVSQRIIFCRAIVVAESLLVQITEKMERLDANVSAINAALQQAPEVFKAVGVDAPVHVLHGMIDNLVRVFTLKSFIGEQGISVESRASFDVLSDFRLQFFFLAAGNHSSADLSATFENTHDSGFVLSA